MKVNLDIGDVVKSVFVKGQTTTNLVLILGVVGETTRFTGSQTIEYVCFDLLSNKRICVYYPTDTLAIHEDYELRVLSPTLSVMWVYSKTNAIGLRKEAF